MKKMIIAIDGYSSTGKSTLAKMLSAHLNYKHINTGAMYRAVTLYAIQKKWIDDSIGFDSIQKDKLIDAIDFLEFNFVVHKSGDCYLYLNGKNIDIDIKSPLVSKYVSVISTYSVIRKKIVKIQRKLGVSKGVVMEGRDIGSVVFPQADLKLFITASIEVRAKRRHNELVNAGIESTFHDVLENLIMRDKFDTSRKNSPLIKVKDAIVIDNTDLDIGQQLDLVVSLLEKK